MPRLALFAASCALALACMAPAAAATVSGSAAGAFAVWISGAPLPPPVTIDVHNKDKSFQPTLAVVGAGGSVRFPNDDPFYHSIYSEGGPDPFDIGYYANGPGKTVPLPNPGLVVVHCHIHPQMHGIIVVADGPYQALSGNDFSFANIGAGKYTVRAIYPDGSVKSQSLSLGAADATVTFSK